MRTAMLSRVGIMADTCPVLLNKISLRSRPKMSGSRVEVFFYAFMHADFSAFECTGGPVVMTPPPDLKG